MHSHLKKKKKSKNLNRKINKAINKAIYDLLHPAVEIVGNIPTYASEDSVGADIKAHLVGINEKFLSKTEIWKISDCLHFDLQEAFSRDNAGAVEAIQKQIDELTDDPVDHLVIYPGGKCLIPTGMYTAFPGIYDAQIRSRSGNALKFEIIVLNEPGTVEGDYKNEWGIIIKNLGNEPFNIKEGDKIAQVVFALKCNPRWIPKSKPEDLSGSNRGGGFGHSDN